MDMNTQPIRFRWLTGGQEDLSDAFSVRLTVFCDEQGYAPDLELDEQDNASWHMVAYDGDKPAATGRLYWKGTDVVGLGRIAVHQAYRGTGLGAQLVQEMLRRATEMGAVWAELDAQCRVIPFYEKQGFVVCGEEHMDGHVPHRMMRRRL